MAILDVTIGVSYIRTAVIIAFIANEGISIIENLGVMGIPFPQIIKDRMINRYVPFLQSPFHADQLLNAPVSDLLLFFQNAAHIPRQVKDYDPERKYVERKDRPEWDYVGMLGRRAGYDPINRIS